MAATESGHGEEDAASNPKRKQTMITRRAVAVSAAAPGMVLLFALSVSMHARGILTVTPGRTANITAGTGAIVYTGYSNSASAATLATPSAKLYASCYSLYLSLT